MISINGIEVDIGEWPSPEVAAVRELMRQRALALGLLGATQTGEGALDSAIERLLAEEVRVPTPTDEECRRYYQNHPDEFTSGDLVHARHILFQVTPSAPVQKIRARAEETLAELLRKPERFPELARELSNCPSGREGGDLGQIARGDTAPEFEQALFRSGSTGILRELARTRYGFHIIAVDRRIPGEALPFAMVQERICERLEAMAQIPALRQYVSILAGEAEIIGLELKRATSPLVQ